MENEFIAYCGVDCAVCPDLSSGKCPGCRQTQWEPGDECMPVACCRGKNIDCCGQCDTFPCADMAEFYKESEGHAAAYERMRAVNREQ